MSQSKNKDHTGKKTYKGKPSHSETEKIRKLKVKDLCVENLKAKTADIQLADINSLQVTDGGIKNLDVENFFLNGQNVSCLINQPGVKAEDSNFNPVLPPTKPDRVNQQVWEALVQSANLELNGPHGGAFASASISGNILTISQLLGGDVAIGQTVLGFDVVDSTIITGGAGSSWTVNISQEVPLTNITFNSPILTECLAGVEPEGLRARIQCGREFVNAFLIEKGCAKPCPPCPPGPTGTICEVPMEIYAIRTIPIFSVSNCGATGTTGSTGATGAIVNFLVNVNFDLDVNYQLEVAGSTDSRVVSVVCLLGYIDPLDSSTVLIELLKIGNRQFYPTLDVLYGENYNGVINIPSDRVVAAYNAMPDPNNTGAVQLIVYKEKGVCIWTDEGCRGGGLCEKNCNSGQLVSSAAACSSGKVEIGNRETLKCV